MASGDDDQSLLSMLDAASPVPLASFDAFPKLPSSFKTRSESRGFMTLFVSFLAFLLMLNDLGEYVWGWPDHEFSVDSDKSSFMNINVDLVVNMPCRYISIDLRDAVGDRLFLSGHGLRRDGTKFDVGQATKLKEHSDALTARQAVAQSRNSRGFFATILQRGNKDLFKPTYNYEPHGSACRVWGSLEVKKVTANLHITTLGHGYASNEHVDHKFMNLSHVISEFSFGPHFPEIAQPLDLSYETTHDPFVAYQYFLHVVPTTYIAPRSKPLRTNQYSVTHYTRVMEHNRGTPGIFFKFDLDPMSLTIHQRTTSFVQLLIRCFGVIGGVFVCMGYAIRVTTKAVEVVTGGDDPGLVAAEASGAKIGLRSKWGGGEIRSRSKIVRQGSGWAMEGAGYIGSPGSGYGSYSNTPVGSPYLSTAAGFSQPGTPNLAVGYGSPSAFGPSSPNLNRYSVPPPPPSRGSRTSSLGVEADVLPSAGSVFEANPIPGTPSYSLFPPTPNPAVGGGFPTGPPPPFPGSPNLSAGGGTRGFPTPPKAPKKDD